MDRDGDGDGDGADPPSTATTTRSRENRSTNNSNNRLGISYTDARGDDTRAGMAHRRNVHGGGEEDTGFTRTDARPPSPFFQNVRPVSTSGAASVQEYMAAAAQEVTILTHMEKEPLSIS